MNDPVSFNGVNRDLQTEKEGPQRRKDLGEDSLAGEWPEPEAQVSGGVCNAVGRPGLELHSCGLWAGSCVSLGLSVVIGERIICTRAGKESESLGRSPGGGGGVGVTGLGMGAEAQLPEGPGQGRC